MSTPILQNVGTTGSYPAQIDELGRYVAFNDIEAIKANLINLLSTKKGSRFMRRSYGTRLHKLLFKPATQTFEVLFRDLLFEAVSEWIPAIKIKDVLFDYSDSNSGVVFVTINFIIKNRNEKGSYVYPFYTDKPY